LAALLARFELEMGGQFYGTKNAALFDGAALNYPDQLRRNWATFKESDGCGRGP
jgi:hypothetical protein